VTVTTPTFWKYLSGVMSRLSMRTRLPNLKFVPSAVLEQMDRQTDRPEQAYQKRQRGYMVIAGRRC